MSEQLPALLISAIAALSGAIAFLFRRGEKQMGRIIALERRVGVVAMVGKCPVPECPYREAIKETNQRNNREDKSS